MRGESINKSNSREESILKQILEASKNEQEISTPRRVDLICCGPGDGDSVIQSIQRYSQQIYKRSGPIISKYNVEAPYKYAFTELGMTHSDNDTDLHMHYISATLDGDIGNLPTLSEDNSNYIGAIILSLDDAPNLLLQLEEQYEILRKLLKPKMEQVPLEDREALLNRLSNMYADRDKWRIEAELPPDDIDTHFDVTLPIPILLIITDSEHLIYDMRATQYEKEKTIVEAGILQKCCEYSLGLHFISMNQSDEPLSSMRTLYDHLLFILEIENECPLLRLPSCMTASSSYMYIFLPAGVITENDLNKLKEIETLKETPFDILVSFKKLGKFANAGTLRVPQLEEVEILSEFYGRITKNMVPIENIQASRVISNESE